MPNFRRDRYRWLHESRSAILTQPHLEHETDRAARVLREDPRPRPATTNPPHAGYRGPRHIASRSFGRDATVRVRDPHLSSRVGLSSPRPRKLQIIRGHAIP